MKKKNIVLILSVIIIFIAAIFVVNYEKQKSSEAEIRNQKIQAETVKKKAKAEEEKKIAEQKKKEEAQAEEKKKQMDSRYEEGKKLFLDEKYLDAVSAADELIKEDPEYYQAYNLKGIALCYYGTSFGGENFTEGMKNIDKSLKLKPDYAYGMFNKALAYELYAKYDDAIDWYNKSLAVEKYEWSYYGIASIYGRKGDVENSVKYLNLAIAMNSSIKDYAKTEPDFNNVRNSEAFQNAIK